MLNMHVGDIKGEYNKNISSSIDSWSEFSSWCCFGNYPIQFSSYDTFVDVSALAAGNSFILKPSEKDPLATIFITKLFNGSSAKGVVEFNKQSKRSS